MFQNIVEGGKIQVNNVNGYRLTVTSTNLSSGATTDIIYDWEPLKSNGETAISANFTLATLNSDNGGSVTDMCYTGSGRFRLIYYKETTRLYVDAAYGHRVVNVTPGFSVDTDGLNFGVDFDIGIREQHRWGWFNRNFKVDDEQSCDEGIFGYGDNGYKTYL